MVSEQIVNDALAEIGSAQTSTQLSDIRVKYLGKKGGITMLMKQMGGLAPDERPAFGQAVNAARKSVEDALLRAAQEIARQESEQKLKAERIDITLPGRAQKPGALHPLTQVYHEVRDIFLSMGFDVTEGPEVELDEYNFELLNIPKNHPARDMQDTFYVSEDVVLRTHTSPVQVRTMLTQKPPIRMVCPGRVFRTDDVDATHSPVFMQMEGLVIGKNIRFSDLKGTINTFIRNFYGENVKTKFRPGFFPFTEPSAEVDVTCTVCGGKGCGACKGAGMIEVLGCGLVNPVVLENCGIDPTEYSGFAFGMGIDRLANTKYGITDIRLLYENDARFLRQFV
ncbi:MAG: phenylalanine--tRNA ligase subunit alpha [Christensenella hongkongensis]|uniref:phenylalanine--tRNA ligase subunit alpha n=1 Tax=Christensenella hongkongensis TaxID=270498 RepID=UPI002672A4D8|nr:phenylalanine--tRNA ligase subunit alpha [Christensenella hongkongensis]MDY3003576.1 phenylalanine--tRNA ligase subunit alpha [Christensenella hongkongensis]